MVENNWIPYDLGNIKHLMKEWAIHKKNDGRELRGIEETLKNIHGLEDGGFQFKGAFLSIGMLVYMSSCYQGVRMETRERGFVAQRG